MTTIFGKEIECAVCGLTNEYCVLGSTNAMGSPDLDLRPPEMQRSTMDTWIQECPECGYCSEDISEFVSNAAEIIASTKYKKLDQEQQFPKLARQFRKYACLIETENKLVSAMAHLRAAWVCDDTKGKHNEVRICRDMTIADMYSLLPYKDSENDVTRAAINVDVLRRAERYEDALGLIEELLSFQSVNDVIRTVLEFQRDKCSKNDHRCYTIAAAFGE